MVSPNIQTTEAKMKATVDGLAKELASIRTGRATPSLIEHIKVDYEGMLMPLNQIAGISAPGGKLLVIQPWDRNYISHIEKAILKSDLGLTPSSDGNVIRLNIPPLNEERRQELIKIVKKRVEERKIAVRNLRRDAMSTLKEMEKEKEISQDDHKRAADQLQKITDNFITSIDKIAEDKEAELMEV